MAITIGGDTGASLPNLNNSQEFTSSGTFNIPTDVKWVYVSAISGGSGGGRNNTQGNGSLGGQGGANSSGTANGGGGGGGGDFCLYKPLYVGNDVSVPVVIGAGGIAETNGGITSVGDLTPDLTGHSGGGGGSYNGANYAGGHGGNGCGNNSLLGGAPHTSAGQSGGGGGGGSGLGNSYGRGGGGGAGGASAYSGAGAVLGSQLGVLTGSAGSDGYVKIYWESV